LGSKYSPLPGDVIDAKLEPGEYVLNRNAVNAIGKEKLDEINYEEEPRFQEGGPARRGTIGTPNIPKIMKKKLAQIQQEKEYRAVLKRRVPPESYDDHIKLREKEGMLMTIEEQMEVLDYFAKLRGMPQRGSKPEMNEGGSIMDRLDAQRQFNQYQYDNPSIMFKDNSLFARMSRKEENDDIALRQATNARIKQYHDEVKAIEQRAKLRKLKMENALYGPEPLDIRKQDYSVNLQDIKPLEYSGPEFNADDFNQMLGSKSVLHKFAERHDMLDSSGRNPFFDKDYGKVKGIDYKNWEMPKNRKLTPAEQLAATMKNAKDEKFNTLLDDSSPAVKQILKDNPFLKQEHLRRKDARLAMVEKERQKTSAEIASEYSPYAMHNMDIQKELVGDPNDPSDDYGSSMADAIKRGKERDELYWQNKDIEMMNPGTAPAYLMKDRNDPTGEKYIRTHDEEVYKKYRAEGRRIEKERMADMRHSNVIKERALRKNAMSKDPKLRKEYQEVNRALKSGDKGIRLGSKKKYKEETEKLKDIKAVKAVVPKLPEGKKSMWREFIKGGDQGRHKKSRDILEKYVYQRGGKVRYYNTGAFVQPLIEQNEGGPDPMSIRRQELSIDLPEPAMVKAKGINTEQGLDDIGMSMLSKGELAARGGSRAIANAAKGRYGRGFTSGKNQAMEEIASKMQWGDKNWDDMSREEQIEASKQVRDTGVGMDKYQKARMWGRGVTQAGNQIGEDLLTAGKGAIGAVGVGAAGLYKGAGALYEGAGKAYKGAKEWLGDDTGHADMMDVMAGEARGSNRQRVGKGLSFLGTGLRQLSSMHGYDPGDGFNQWKKKDEDPGKLLDADEQQEQETVTEETPGEVKENVQLEDLGLSTPKEVRPEVSGFEESYEEGDPYGENKGYDDLFGFQHGGHVPMDSFIRHSWRNMQWK